MQDSDEVVATLHKLRDLGLKIALDDFGTGYSSLGYLQRTDFGKIKIDRSFIQSAATGNSESLAIIQAIVALAQAIASTKREQGVGILKPLPLVSA